MSDVCLILEGTYPYVTGGVSSCVYQLIRNTPYINYSLIYIGASADSDKEYRYPIPDNVKLIKEVYLFDYKFDEKKSKTDINVNLDLLMKFHQGSREQKAELFEELYHELIRPNNENYNPFDLLYSRQAWEYLSMYYKMRFANDDAPSFIDYFYTWRFTHYPLFKILSTELPRAKVYHSLSTGYAGILGAVAKIRGNCSYMLTEHGIYSHEREIEIYQADWIYNTDKDLQVKSHISFFKEWWIKLFHFMGNAAYSQADVITTLYNGNKEKQVKYGADPDKIEILPNGIDYASFSELGKNKTWDKDHIKIALVGRVVPIKDIKTFIKSIATLVRKGTGKKIEAFIIGPFDEDADYNDECRKLTTLLGLDSVITFTGKVNVKEFYPNLDLLVLSSISEGQPMVILEGFAAGLPSVSTDVGSCKELIFGMSEEDKELGAAGAIVPFGKPEELGNAILKVMENEEVYNEMCRVAQKRAETYYREDIYIDNYVSVYNRLLGKFI